MAVHPDKHATKGDDVKMMSQQQSSHLNTGFSILKCPLARAKYLVRFTTSTKSKILKDDKCCMQLCVVRFAPLQNVDVYFNSHILVHVHVHNLVHASPSAAG